MTWKGVLPALGVLSSPIILIILVCSLRGANHPGRVRLLSPSGAVVLEVKVVDYNTLDSNRIKFTLENGNKTCWVGSYEIIPEVEK